MAMTASARYTNRRKRFQMNGLLLSTRDSQRLTRSLSSGLHQISTGNSRETSGNISPHNSKRDNFTMVQREDLTVVERLSAHIVRLDCIFQNIIDYKVDAEHGSNIALSLAKSIQSTTEYEITFNLLSHIHKLAKNHASLCGLVMYPELIKAIVTILQSTTNVRIQTESALIVQLLTKTESGAKLISEELGIPILIKMLRHPTEVIRTTALYVLNQLMWYWPNDSRPEFRNNDGQFNLIELLEKNKSMDTNWLLICLDTLRMALYENADAKLSLLQTNVHSTLVRLLRTYSHNTKLVYNIARLIKVLSVCNTNKARLVESGAVEALTPLLSSSNEALQLEILWGMRNLSDQAYHLEMTKNLIPMLINLLTNHNEHISICAIGCLCNLTCRNAHNKDIFVKKGGVRLLCEILTSNIDRQEIIEPTCSALRHVTHRNTHAAAAIYEIRTHNTLPSIATILLNYDFMSTLPVIKSVIGLVRNVATEKESCDELSDLRISTVLVRILHKSYDQVSHDQAQNITSTLPKDVDTADYLDGVSFVDMVELTLSTLQILSKNESVHEELIHTANLLTIVVQLIYSSSTYFQRAATALLSQLSTSHAGCVAIQREGACPRLTELIQSDNEYIAAYSAAVLHHISKNKPEDYRRRLSIELRQSLFDGGVLNGNRIQKDETIDTNYDGTIQPKCKDSKYCTKSAKQNRLHNDSRKVRKQI